MSTLPTPPTDNKPAETAPPPAESRIVFSRDDKLIADIADKVGCEAIHMTYKDLAGTK